MSDERVAVVVPTCRPDGLRAWWDQWKEQFDKHGVMLYVIHDSDTVRAAGVPGIHRCWGDIEKDWGDAGQIFQRHTDNIRCYGYWLAVRDGAEIVVTLDDDVVPEGDTIGDHVAALQPIKVQRWASTANIRVRGLPYGDTEQTDWPVLSHGLWKGVPDLDAPCQLVNPNQEAGAERGVVQHGAYFPMCGMNIAFRKEALPAMLWPPMGGAHPYERFGDIWCGVLAKRVFDHLGLPVVNAAAWVKHQRASNVYSNLVKEAPGIVENERFWKVVDAVDLYGQDDIAGCMARIADHFGHSRDGYYRSVAAHIKEWLPKVACVLP